MFRSPRVIGVPLACSDGKFRPRYPDGAGWVPSGDALEGDAVGVVSAAANLTVPASGGDTFPHANALFADNFESQALRTVATRTWNPQRNETGFYWNGTNYTSLGTATARVFGNDVINDPISNWSGQEWPAPVSGSASLLFAYAAGNEYTMSEQRFELGRHEADAWFRYKLRIPPNYEHNGGGQKFAAFWVDSYDGEDDVTFMLERGGSGWGGTSNDIRLTVQDRGVDVPQLPVANLFTLADAGRIMEVVIRVRASTGARPTNNGIIQFWRRFDGDAAFTQLYSKTNAEFNGNSGLGVSAGYLLGWSNAPTFTQTTWWSIDEFQYGSGSLL